jgi:enoyl-CoA hydratase/carnithine racemase
VKYKTLFFEKTGQVATITINRSESMNAINSELIADFSMALDALEADETIRAMNRNGWRQSICRRGGYQGNFGH